MQDDKSGITIEQFAKARGMHVDKLKSFGLTNAIYNGSKAICIPYMNDDGTLFRNRFRISMDGSIKFKWDGKKDVGTIPYGRDRLKAITNHDYIVIVEGESDSWCMWHFDYPCIGIPGSSNYRSLSLQDVEAFQKVYVYKERDKAGEQFVINIKKHLLELGYKGAIESISFPKVKDISEEFLPQSKWFDHRFDALIKDGGKEIEIPPETPNPVISYAPVDSGDRVPTERLLEKYLDGAEVGNRHNSCFELCLQLRDNGYDQIETESVLDEFRDEVDDGSNPFHADEVKSIVKSVYSQEPRKPWRKPYQRTDLGNAERFRDAYGDIAMFNPAAGWIVWNEKHWQLDADALANQLAFKLVKNIEKEAGFVDDPDKKKKMLSWIRKCQSRASIYNMLELAKPMMMTGLDIFDTHKDLLCVNNGIIDLKTGKLSPHRANRYITKCIDIDYDPNAECPLFKSFLNQIMQDNENMIDYIQRACGYAATGHASERTAFFLYGNGANGKSVFLEVIRATLGPYSAVTPAESLMDSGMNNSASSDIARLRGIRLLTASETKKDVRLNENKLKAMTGNETIVARYLYKEYFEFLPEFTPFVATNHLPIVSDNSEAIWDRIKQVPFKVRIPAEKRDKQLIEKLKNELTGILNWIIEGSTKWYKHGLGDPDEVITATNSYRSDMDSIKAFIDDGCILGEDKKAGLKELFIEYEKYMNENDEYPATKKEFGKALQARGFSKVRYSSGFMFKGIGLITENHQ